MWKIIFVKYIILQSFKSENIAEDHIIKFAFDTAQDLLKIGEDPIILDNEKKTGKSILPNFLNG